MSIWKVLREDTSNNYHHKNLTIYSSNMKLKIKKRPLWCLRVNRCGTGKKSPSTHQFAIHYSPQLLLANNYWLPLSYVWQSRQFRSPEQQGHKHNVRNLPWWWICRHISHTSATKASPSSFGPQSVNSKINTLSAFLGSKEQSREQGSESSTPASGKFTTNLTKGRCVCML